ncbi:MAG TPA: BPSS1780 family membrane protein [Gallionella sp.]|nr:BPSS1780 family membrane protein [Gallionella sp.]
MEPQRLQAGEGWQWMKQGYALFMKAPLLWMVLLMICFIAMAGLSAIPVVGEPLSSLLLPAVMVGLMTGCRALEQGEELELAHLFNGFQQHTAQLVTLGGIALVGQFLILGLMMMVGGATLVSILMSGQPPQEPQILAQAIAGAGLAVLIGITLFSILLMAMQFAPMLVYFQGVTPIEAMKLSLRAFLVNIGPMLVYGIVFILLAFLASIPMMLGWLVLIPVMITSLYVCYSSIFPQQKESEVAAGPGDEDKPNEGTL